MRPRVFIASSRENLKVVRAMRDAIEASERIDVEPVPWNEGTFEPSRYIMESLERALDESSYAVIVLTPDDFEKVRKEKYRVPRDNALLELGLFIGRRGRDHCYIVHVAETARKKHAFRLPPDIGGIKPITYSERNDDEFRHSIASACDQILRTIEKREAERQRTYCGRMAGQWWEIIEVEDSRELSFFKIVPNDSYSMVEMEGDHYKRIDGVMTHIGHWHTTAVGLHEEDRKVTYCWSGHHPHARRNLAPHVEGYGWLQFNRSTGAFRRGNGAFLDLSPGISRNWKVDARWKDVKLLRAAAAEAEKMTSDSEPERLAEAARRLGKAATTGRGGQGG